MDKKKSLTKAGSSAKTAQLPAKKTAQKQDKKGTPVKAEKKKELRVKATASSSKAASLGKKTAVPLAEAAGKKTLTKEKPETAIKSGVKTAAKPAATKSASGKRKLTKASEGKEKAKEKIPTKTKAKKSPLKAAASINKPAPAKTVKVMTPNKAAAEKPGKGVAGKIAVKTTKGIKAAAKAETTPVKDKKSAAKAAKAAPKKKFEAKGSPVTKETAGAKLKPGGKAIRPQAATRKTVKKKVKSAVYKGLKKTPEIQDKTAAIYAASSRREKKLKRAFDLRVFLPEEELPEEPQIPPPSELREEYFAASSRREKKLKRAFDLRVFLPEEELPEEELQLHPPSELPEEYGENELLLLEVDPSRVFASWEIKPEDIAGEKARLILRVYDVTGIDLEKVQSARFFDIPIKHRVDSKFFDIKMPGREVIMEIGLLYPEGSFKAIRRSHRVSMPELQSFKELGITGLLSDSDSLIGY